MINFSLSAAIESNHVIVLKKFNSGVTNNLAGTPFL
jgi:hypothetical protein